MDIRAEKRIICLKEKSQRENAPLIHLIFFIPRDVESRSLNFNESRCNDNRERIDNNNLYAGYKKLFNSCPLFRSFSELTLAIIAKSMHVQDKKLELHVPFRDLRFLERFNEDRHTGAEKVISFR